MTRSTPSTDTMLRCMTAALVVGALRHACDLHLIAGAVLAARMEDDARLAGLWYHEDRVASTPSSSSSAEPGFASTGRESAS